VAERTRRAGANEGQARKEAETMSEIEAHDEVAAVGDRDIAVIGMAGRFPAARDLAQFWKNLENGVESVTYFTDEELIAAGVPREHLAAPNYVKAASMIEGAELFDADFFGYTPREAAIIDPQQRLFLEHAWEALENAGYAPDGYDGLIGIYAGVAWNTYLLSNLATHPELFAGGRGFQLLITSDKDFMPTRVSYKLNLKGPSVIVATSCSTSLVATHLACLSLLNYECDMALVGGATVKVPILSGYHYQEGSLASPDGHCRAFDAQGAGTIFGSGIGVMVLKRLAEALEDGDAIRAVIKGSAINNDGSVKVSYTAPSVEGQAEVIAAAHEMAGIHPETIRYIETHGTGTSLGDPIEVTALTKVFRETTDKKAFCALGSLKSNVGHLDAAAGVGGLIKTVLALEHRRIPPSLHFEQPNPAIDFATSPFYVNSELAEWPRDTGPRRAAVSSFGVGGTNAHVILQEAPELPASGPSRPWQLLVLSAKTETALAGATENLLDFLRENDVNLADVAYTLRRGRAVFRHRWALVCRDRNDALEVLEGRDPGRQLTDVDTEDPRDRPIVFLCSGQGAQYVNMARGLYDDEAVFRKEVDHSAELLRPLLGCDLRQVLFPAAGEEAEATEQLGRTRLTQPALFVVEYALARLWMAWGVVPRAMIGHSIGEYVAACLAGVFSLQDALTLVAARGRLMDEQPAGDMLAVPLPEEEVTALLDEEVSLAAVNEPSRCVVSGPAAAVAALESRLTERGVGTRRLHTSHAFHSPMMDPVLEPFAAELRKVELRPPEIPFISNLTGTWITAEEATDPDYWVRHLRRPVRFAQGVEELYQDPERILLEIGPGRTLATLAGRHPARSGQPVVTSLRHPQDEGEDLPLLFLAMVRLWLAGAKLDAALFYGDEKRRRVALPTYAFDRRRYWIEPGVRIQTAEAALAEPALGKRTELADWFYLPSWKSSLPPAAASPPASWLVFVDRDGLGAALVARLAAEGREVIAVEAAESFRPLRDGVYAINPRQREDYDALLEALRSSEKIPGVIVHAWSLTRDQPAIRDAGAFEDSQARGFYSLLILAQALEKLAPVPALEVAVVSNALHAVTAAEPLRFEKATMLGLCRVLPQELPNVTCRAVDVIPPAPGSEEEARLVDRLIAEIAARSDDEAVAYRGPQRWVESFESIRLEAPEDAQQRLRDRGVYLVTGGLAGNGYALATFLARSYQARLVLAEETPLPPKDQWPELAATEAADEEGELLRIRRAQALEALGAEVLVLDAALTDEAPMQRALDAAVEGFGALHGVIHAAGMVGQRAVRAIRETGYEETAWHFVPKIHALFVLERVLADRELDFAVLISSSASILGGLAYGAYTAANLAMDAFARDPERRGIPWCSVNWDVWQLPEEGAEQVTAVRQDLAELAMTPQEGEEAFRRLLAREPLAQIVVSTAELAARIVERRERISAHRKPVAPAARHPRPQLQNPYVAPETELEQVIAGVWQEVLGFEQIGIDDNFFDLGGDSFVAVQVVSRLKEALQVDLPMAQLFQRLTIRSLAELLAMEESEAIALRAEQLAERRESMSRRRAFQQRRRSQKKSKPPQE